MDFFNKFHAFCFGFLVLIIVITVPYTISLLRLAYILNIIRSTGFMSVLLPVRGSVRLIFLQKTISCYPVAVK